MCVVTLQPYEKKTNYASSCYVTPLEATPSMERKEVLQSRMRRCELTSTTGRALLSNTCCVVGRHGKAVLRRVSVLLVKIVS